VAYGAARGEEEDLEAFPVLMARQAPGLRGLVIVSALGLEENGNGHSPKAAWCIMVRTSH